MKSIIAEIDSQLAALPVPITLQLPDGRRVARPDSRVMLAFTEWSALTKLATRQIGAIGEAYVEGRTEIDGTMRDLIEVTVGLLPPNLAQNPTPLS